MTLLETQRPTDPSVSAVCVTLLALSQMVPLGHKVFVRNYNSGEVQSMSLIKRHEADGEMVYDILTNYAT